jgi:hypothetical protein
MKTLWHLNSKVLGGFYASDIYVAAEDKAEAIANATAAFDAFFEERLKEYGYFQNIHSWDDDNDAEKAELRASMIAEIEEKIIQIPGPGLVVHHI